MAFFILTIYLLLVFWLSFPNPFLGFPILLARYWIMMIKGGKVGGEYIDADTSSVKSFQG